MGVFSAAFPTSQKWCQKNCKIDARMDPDWIPTTGEKWCQRQNWCRLDPDWIWPRSRFHRAWMHGSVQTQLCPYFLFPSPSRAPIPLPSCTKTAKAVLSQTGFLQKISCAVVVLPRHGQCMHAGFIVDLIVPGYFEGLDHDFKTQTCIIVYPPLEEILPGKLFLKNIP